MRRLMTIVKIILLMSAVIAGSVLAQPAHIENQKFPDVVSVDVHARGEDHFDFDVTISSPYDTPRRYADAFRIMSQDAVIYGVRDLLHDHADEQPFTRDLYGVHVNAGVKELVIQARDTKYGYGGKTLTVILPGR
jgi:hypothetical protein